MFPATSCIGSLSLAGAKGVIERSQVGTVLSVIPNAIGASWIMVTGSMDDEMVGVVSSVAIIAVVSVPEADVVLDKSLLVVSVRLRLMSAVGCTDVDLWVSDLLLEEDTVLWF